MSDKDAYEIKCIDDQLHRIDDDIRHGGKMGQASAVRLLDGLRQLLIVVARQATRINELEKRP